MITAYNGCGGLVERDSKIVGLDSGAAPDATAFYLPSDAGSIRLDASASDGTTWLDTGPALEACDKELVETNLFAADDILFPSGAPRTFYSWTTEEQIAELRSTQVLFSRTERTGLGRGLALDSLAALGAAGTSEQNQLARILNEQVFVTIRYAWSNPWATRLGWPNETYGNQLIRVDLVPEAWIAQFDGSSLYVMDGNNNEIPLAQVLATPERIGAIYFFRGSEIGGPYCGTFASGDNGYREFILGNIAMVKEWSIATQDLRDRLNKDIGDLSAFREILKPCPLPEYYSYDFNADVACGWTESWGADYLGLAGLRTYENALAIPNELYYPTPDAIQQLIATLQADLFEPDPLIVKPNG